MSAAALVPQTAREALLELRVVAAQVHVDSDPTEVACQVDRVALEGLTRTEPINFELTDQLADRLAEAHTLLRELRAPLSMDGNVADKIDAALALPPDLETMVERRMRR